MSTTDLLTRAREAVTVEEECDVINSTLSKAMAGEMDVPHLGTAAILALSGTVTRVREHGLPRAVLLGVVAALVPEGSGMRVDGPVTSGGRKYWEAECGPSMEEIGPTPALALLIAILEAGNV